MIDKLLTLISGNLLLVKKAIEQENKTLTERLESSQNKTTEALEGVTMNVKEVAEAMTQLAKAIEEREDREIEVPEIEMPEIKIPDFPKFPKFPEIPTPQVTVNVPEIVVPAPVVNIEPQITVTPTPVTFPKEMSVVGLSEWFKKVIELLSKEKKETEWSKKNPMPVAFIDRNGRQYDLIHLGTPRGGSGGGVATEINTLAPQYALRLSNPSNTIRYIGEAEVGSATSSATWRIKKVDTTTGVIIKWAGGSASFDKVWDDHLTYSYS